MSPGWTPSRSTRLRRPRAGRRACCATSSASGSSSPRRSEAGYRLYGPAELQRLRTLRELLAEHDVGLSDLAFALRLRSDDRLRSATEDWLEAQAERPEHVPVPDWLRWEQEKHQRLLTTTTPLTEVA